MKDLQNITWKFQGITDETFRYVENFHLTDATYWRRFVEQFRIYSDSKDKGWKGEFWGKMMRGASLVYAYTRNEKLYEILRQSVEDMMESSDLNGRISSYSKEEEFSGWDIWSRKYVMLGMEYFLEICKEEDVRERVLASMKGQADYLLSMVGPEEDKIDITQTAIYWRGLSASSMLEPIVRLYQLTGEERYLKFAEYIVDNGGTSIVNIFRLAYEDQLYPYQYPVTKAYEMISCFEGLLALYRVTGTAWYKDALVRFADKVLESDYTIIGCCGCTNELFDHSTVRQANTNNEWIMQETCVTVTLMKFLYQMTLLTDDPAYADAFERSYYNAYLGAVNTENCPGIDYSKICDGAFKDAIAGSLPFDSYSPLTAGTRGDAIAGGQLMPDNHYYGCCACIGSAGIGLVPKMTLLQTEKGFAMNLFIAGEIKTETPAGQKLILQVDTMYPRNGEVVIRMLLDKPEQFTFALRNPAWNEQSTMTINGEAVTLTEGYITLDHEWKDGDVICYRLDMRTRAISPIAYGTQILMTQVVWQQDYVVPRFDIEDPKAKDHMALQRGPIVLTAENQLGYSVDDAFPIRVREDGFVDAVMPEEEIAPYPHMVEMTVPLEDGRRMHLTDYGSAGKTWSKESKLAAWIRVR